MPFALWRICCWDMSRQVVLISCGPQQLLTQIALMAQLERTEDVAGVVSYVGGNERVIEFDKWLCEIFGFEYLGSISNFSDKVVELGFGGFAKAFSTIARRDLNHKVSSWLRDLGILPKIFQAEIVISFRENLVSDRLLMDIIAPISINFIPDGIYISMGRNIKNRLIGCFLG